MLGRKTIVKTTLIFTTNEFSLRRQLFYLSENLIFIFDILRLAIVCNHDKINILRIRHVKCTHIIEHLWIIFSINYDTNIIFVCIETTTIKKGEQDHNPDKFSLMTNELDLFSIKWNKCGPKMFPWLFSRPWSNKLF